MEKKSYIKLSNDQIDKVGNSIVYLSEKIGELSKTKALKLIYILDELSIKKSGIPFFNLKYKLWKFGPVSEEIFIDLSSETTLLKNYIERTSEEGVTVIKPIVEFNDDEFSDNDIDLLNFVIEQFGDKTAKDLVYYTHRKNSPWHNTAKENSVLELLEKEEINNTELLIDMASLINHDERKKVVYSDFIESN
ncbi:Panacea domain-containing protein [uncultured Nonlabens sp.]|uniref:Panacea domain-containing protein n=1 Tax=uncultured Nonlabens sp. TaxID=859306 RepID=UPI00260C7699|nr:Panacea domain-containing protein [uncultured Nonlabens sp.]